MVQIHPCDPVKPSEFFCMSVLEAMAAGTPCVISDADALPELWSQAAIVLPRPIDYSEWTAEVEDLMDDTIIAPGHGPLTTAGNERRFNPFLA